MFESQYIGNVAIFAGNFAPQNWNFCDGSLISIAINPALFSILGTTFGGDGISNFALPDLRGRVAIHAGQGPGFSNFVPGQTGGAESTSLTLAQMPVHNHSVMTLTGTPPAANSAGTTDMPTGNVPAIINGSPSQYTTVVTDTMGAGLIASTTPSTGIGAPIDTRSPYLAMNYVICMEGIYPSHP